MTYFEKLYRFVVEVTFNKTNKHNGTQMTLQDKELLRPSDKY